MTIEEANEFTERLPYLLLAFERWAGIKSYRFKCQRKTCTENHCDANDCCTIFPYAEWISTLQGIVRTDPFSDDWKTFGVEWTTNFANEHDSKVCDIIAIISECDISEWTVNFCYNGDNFVGHFRFRNDEDATRARLSI